MNGSFLTKGVFRMARNTIKYSLKQALERQASYGRSKHDDKLSTNEKRAELREQGATFAQRLDTNDMDGHIYSYGTMRTYQQQVGYFGDWLIEQGLKRISIEESKVHIQEYIDHLTDKGYSAWTVRTAASAICKATGEKTKDYTLPTRSVADVKRGKGTRIHDKLNSKRAARILEANRILGMRRSELKKLRASDITGSTERATVQYYGKGGRLNTKHFDGKEAAFVLSLKDGKEEHERLFSAKEFDNDADLHSMRQQRALDVYNRVCEDMRKHPERREHYIEEIKKAYRAQHRVCCENFDNPYYVRGANRQRLLAEGRPLEYDRVAVLYVSTEVLNHTRADVSVQHYIAK